MHELHFARAFHYANLYKAHPLSMASPEANLSGILRHEFSLPEAEIVNILNELDVVPASAEEVESLVRRAVSEANGKVAHNVVFSATKDKNPNESTGAGYGLRISSNDRGRFRRTWEHMELEWDQTSIKIPITASFFDWCRLNSRQLGLVLVDRGLHNWPDFKPTKIVAEQILGNTFRVLSA